MDPDGLNLDTVSRFGTRKNACESALAEAARCLQRAPGRPAAGCRGDRLPFLPLFALLAFAEPGLAEVQQAAARTAAGEAADDASRGARARRAHLAPVLHLQGQLKDDERTRRGEVRLAPLHEDDAGQGRGAALTLVWDLPQLVYAREEGQLALAHAQLAKARREASEKAAGLWLARKRAQLALLSLSKGPQRVEARLLLLALTAGLDALTGGLFREAVSREESACAEEEKP